MAALTLSFMAALTHSFMAALTNSLMPALNKGLPLLPLPRACLDWALSLIHMTLTSTAPFDDRFPNLRRGLDLSDFIFGER